MSNLVVPESPLVRLNLKRYIILFIVFLSVWAFVYLPILYSIHQPPLEYAWMLEQRYLPHYILPANVTNLLNPKNICQPVGSAKFLTLVIIVCSSIPNTESRKAIRQTWGKYAAHRAGVRIYFLVGSTLNKTLDANIERENQKYGDIIQENFLDTYNNLTIKSTMMLKWVDSQCQSVKFVMKTDDDMFVNVPNLIQYLNRNGTDKLLVGCLIKKSVPIKNKHSKWYAPEEVYNKLFYPDYLSGTGYVMARSLVHPLYNTALETPFFYMEDIFITGICAEKLKIARTNNEGFKFLKRKNDPCIFRSVITAHHMSPKEFYIIWRTVNNSTLKCKIVKIAKSFKAFKNTVKS